MLSALGALANNSRLYGRCYGDMCLRVGIRDIDIACCWIDYELIVWLWHLLPEGRSWYHIYEIAGLACSILTVQGSLSTHRF